MVNQIPGDLVNETGDLHGISFSIIHSLGALVRVRVFLALVMPT